MLPPRRRSRAAAPGRPLPCLHCPRPQKAPALTCHLLDAPPPPPPRCDAVFHLELPTDAAHYAHRAGRTGRRDLWLQPQGAVGAGPRRPGLGRGPAHRRAGWAAHCGRCPGSRDGAADWAPRRRDLAAAHRPRGGAPPEAGSTTALSAPAPSSIFLYRAGRHGTVVSLVAGGERHVVERLGRRLGVRISEVEVAFGEAVEKEGEGAGSAPAGSSSSDDAPAAMGDGGSGAGDSSGGGSGGSSRAAAPRQKAAGGGARRAARAAPRRQAAQRREQ